MLASLLCDTDRQFDCNICPEQQRQLRGCSKFGVEKLPQSPGVRLPINGDMVRLDDCPEALVPEHLRGCVRQYAHYAGDRLWYPGSVGQQPSLYLRKMEVLASQVAEVQKVEREKKEQEDLRSHGRVKRPDLIRYAQQDRARGG